MPKKRISDEFTIRIGEDWRSGCGFICGSKRKGAKLPEPLDDHRVQNWIISELHLEHMSNYRIRVTVTLLEKLEEDKKTKR